MKRHKIIKLFIIILLGLFLVDDVGASDSACPELPYFMTDYMNEHKNLIKEKCMEKGYLDEECGEVAGDAYDKFMNCFEDCGGYSDAGCEHILMSGDCSYYKCTTEIDNNCAKKCRNYLFFDFGLDGSLLRDESNNADNNNSNGVNLEEELIGEPIIPNQNIYPCVGEVPKNSEICLGDDKNVLEYTKKHLVDSCSVPVGSEPKCEYVCKTEHLNDGTCKEEGFFKKILNWLGGLF